MSTCIITVCYSINSLRLSIDPNDFFIDLGILEDDNRNVRDEDDELELKDL